MCPFSKRKESENTSPEKRKDQQIAGLLFVPPRRIERLSSEPESEILSIKLQGHTLGIPMGVQI